MQQDSSSCGRHQLISAGFCPRSCLSAYYPVLVLSCAHTVRSQRSKSGFQHRLPFAVLYIAFDFRLQNGSGNPENMSVVLIRTFSSREKKVCNSISGKWIRQTRWRFEWMLKGLSSSCERRWIGEADIESAFDFVSKMQFLFNKL